MQTLILGGGFGGITVAVELKERLGDAHDVVLIARIDRKDEFVMGAPQALGRGRHRALA